MPTIDLHYKKPFDSATITKLEIFESYLSTWLPTFINTHSINKVNICDFFSGPGYDLNNTPGSPIRILNVLEKFESQIIEKKFRINIFFNDIIRKKYKILQATIDEKLSTLSTQLRNQINISIHNKDFQKLFPQIKTNFLNGPNLFFFDQNGLKHITLDFIIDLESFTQTDYLFFLSSGMAHRNPINDVFPDFEIDLKTIQGKDLHRVIVEELRKRLPKGSKTLLYPFSIKKKKFVHGLVFGATHLLAVEKFLNIAWNINKINGQADFDIDSDLDYQMDLFSGKIKLTKLQIFDNEIQNFAKEKNTFTNEDIYLYTMNRGFAPKHANDALKKMRKNKQIEHFSHAKIGYDQIYKKNKIITFRIKK